MAVQQAHPASRVDRQVEPGGIHHHHRSDVTAHSFLLEPNGQQLGELAALVEGGELVAQVSTVLPLAEAGRAHEMSATGHTRGKTVLAVTS